MKRWPDHGPIPVIVVGFGRMGRLHAETCARMPEFSIQGVVDIDPACGPVAAGMGLPWYPDIRQVPAGARVAIIAVPSTQHAQAFSEIASLGMDCLIEKPVGARLDELETMAHTASATGLKVYAGYSERFNPVMPDIDEALRHVPKEVHVRRTSSVALGRAFDINVLYDLVSHDVDWMIRAFGDEPTGASIQACRYHAGKLEEVECVFHFAPAIQVRINASRIAASHERSITIAGEGGRGAIFQLDSARAYGRADALTSQARALVGALKGEDTPIARIQDALKVQRLLDRLEASLACAASPLKRVAHVG